jgi:hypothetical protein
MNEMTREDLLAQARAYGIPGEEAVGAWEEMVRQHRLPFYVRPVLEERPDGAVQLSPAVDINLLSRLDREVPGWERISGPLWPAGKGGR